MKYLWVFAVLCAALGVRAADADLLLLDSAFVSGRYEEVELLALRTLQSGDSLTADARARVCLTAGYALIMLNREADARDYFKRALAAVPTLTLDPVLVSPKFRVVFDDVKAARPANEARGNAREPNALEKSTPRGSATSARVLNLFLPGAGQLQEKRVIKGAAILALQTAATALWIVEMKNARNTRADYLAATEEADIRKQYDTYNQHYTASWAAGISAGVVYVLAQIDLAMLKPHTEGVKLSLKPWANGVTAAVKW
jgi:hypothetical protein